MPDTEIEETGTNTDLIIAAGITVILIVAVLVRFYQSYKSGESPNIMLFISLCVAFIVIFCIFYYSNIGGD